MCQSSVELQTPSQRCNLSLPPPVQPRTRWVGTGCMETRPVPTRSVADGTHRAPAALFPASAVQAPFVGYAV